MKLARDMTLEEIAARMHEIETRFDNPPFTPADALAMVTEYMTLESEIARRSGGGPIH